MLATIVLLLSGCVTPRKEARREPAQRTDYVLAARVDSQARSAGDGDASARSLQMLQQIHSLGFNTVVLDYLSDDQRDLFLDAAATLGLQTYLADRDLHYYLLTEKVRGSDTLDQLVARRLAPVATHKAFAGAAIFGGYPPQCVHNVVSALERSGIGYLLPGQDNYDVKGASVAWLDANAAPPPGASQVEQLLLEFNVEIFAGWNDGVVIDFAPKADWVVEAISDTASAAALEDESASVPASGFKSQVYAVESVLMRANRWARRLQGFQRVPLAGPGLRFDPALQAAVFVRDKRQYLFLVNQSSQPLRTPVRLPVVLAGRPIARAVEVPVAAERMAGSVFETRGNELTLSISLRPGDAALFELF